jgi:hypothetical protein
MATKQLVTISGAVEAFNAKRTGIKVLGEWLSFSQYHPITPMPTLGELVEVQVEQTDHGAWINSLKILGPIVATPSTPTSRDAEIRRQVTIKTAAQLVGAFAQTHEEVRISHVFNVADQILACGSSEEVVLITERA